MIDDDLHCLGIFYHHHHHQAHQQKLISISSTFRSTHLHTQHTNTGRNENDRKFNY